jgi:DNA-binding CsgD family transcriptional regulator
MRRRGGCDCHECIEAGRRYSRRNAKMRARGTVQLVPAAPARTHVLALLQAGMTIRQVEARSGVHRTAIRVLVGDFPNRRPSHRVRPATAAALLAVPGETHVPVGTATVDATGTRRRLQALLALGYTGNDLARRLGCSTPTLQIARQCRVRAATARAVRALYEELENIPGPSSRARTYYRSCGYLTPAWWDPDTIDNPAVEPEGIRTYAADGCTLIDDVTAPRSARIDLMARRGLDPAAIAVALQLPRRYVYRDLRTAGEAATAGRRHRAPQAEVRRCAGCSRAIRPRSRPDLADGTVIEASGGLCDACYRHQDQASQTARLEHTAREYQHLRSFELTDEEIATRLRVSVRQLHAAAEETSVRGAA